MPHVTRADLFPINMGIGHMNHLELYYAFGFRVRNRSNHLHQVTLNRFHDSLRL